ncbi:MAG: chorismate mutase [Candidatus Acetothermia bacterium]
MIDELRNQIDEIDRDLVRLLNDRGKVAAQIGEEKRKTGREITDTQREEEVLSRVKEANYGPFSDPQIVEIYRKIILETKNLEEVS